MSQLPKCFRWHRTWFVVAVVLSVWAVLDLMVIAGESVTKSLPDSVRCLLVNEALSLQLFEEYTSHEAVIRARTSCPRRDP